MNKDIFDIDISEQNKIVISKLTKKSRILNEKIQDYFYNSISINNDHIKDAFVVNEDLMEILSKKDLIIKNAQSEFVSIKENVYFDLTEDFFSYLTLSKSKNNLIRNILENKDNIIINYDEKFDLLNKKIKFNKFKTKKRKLEFEKGMKKIQNKLNDKNLLKIESMNEDIYLIDKYIDEKKINFIKYLYILPISILFLTIFLIVGGAFLL